MDIIIKVWGISGWKFQGIYCKRYHQGRYFADMKIIAGTRGLDFDTTGDSYNYGNIYKDYDEIGLLIQGKIGQGNKTAVFIADIKLDIW
jgi:hypothetical protein